MQHGVRLYDAGFFWIGARAAPSVTKHYLCFNAGIQVVESFIMQTA